MAGYLVYFKYWFILTTRMVLCILHPVCPSQKNIMPNTLYVAKGHQSSTGDRNLGHGTFPKFLVKYILKKVKIMSVLNPVF